MLKEVAKIEFWSGQSTRVVDVMSSTGPPEGNKHQPHFNRAEILPTNIDHRPLGTLYLN
jgi:hypothetical protein